jgi:hypothetical protein
MPDKKKEIQNIQIIYNINQERRLNKAMSPVGGIAVNLNHVIILIMWQIDIN